MNFWDGTIWMTSPAAIAALHFPTIAQNSSFVISLVNAVAAARGRAPSALALSTTRAIDSALSTRS